jgi:hypothetical protein
MSRQKGDRMLYLRFACRDMSLQLTGPLSALQVLQKLAEAVRFEAARNHILEEMLSPFDKEEDEASARGFKLPEFLLISAASMRLTTPHWTQRAAHQC